MHFEGEFLILEPINLKPFLQQNWESAHVSAEEKSSKASELKEFISNLKYQVLIMKGFVCGWYKIGGAGQIYFLNIWKLSIINTEWPFRSFVAVKFE